MVHSAIAPEGVPTRSHRSSRATRSVAFAELSAELTECATGSQDSIFGLQVMLRVGQPFFLAALSFSMISLTACSLVAADLAPASLPDGFATTPSQLSFKRTLTRSDFRTA